MRPLRSRTGAAIQDLQIRQSGPSTAALVAASGARSTTSPATGKQTQAPGTAAVLRLLMRVSALGAAYLKTGTNARPSAEDAPSVVSRVAVARMMFRPSVGWPAREPSRPSALSRCTSVRAISWIRPGASCTGYQALELRTKGWRLSMARRRARERMSQQSTCQRRQISPADRPPEAPRAFPDPDGAACRPQVSRQLGEVTERVAPDPDRSRVPHPTGDRLESIQTRC